MYFGFGILLILSGAASAYSLRWMADDAFISLRYAKNLADGLGLVFNEGEFVEGYTNFLWTILLYFVHRFESIDPLNACYALGILSFAGTCFYLLLFPLRRIGDESFFPISLFCYAAIHHVRVFATSGLETSLHGFLFVAASYHLLKGDPVSVYKNGMWFSGSSESGETDSNRKFEPSWILGIFLSSLSVLNRPDGILFHGLAALSVFLKINLFSKKGFSSALANAPFRIFCVVCALPLAFYIWKLEYYGNLLPNTFYAKSGGSSYLSQGIVYLRLFFSMYYGLIPVFGAAFFFGIRTAVDFLRSGKDSSFRSDWILLFLFPVLYFGYYTWIGGDFMFSRFYLPVLPLFLLWVEKNLLLSIEKKSAGFTKTDALLLAVPILLLLRWDLYKGTTYPVLNEIADENQVYKREDLERLRGIVSPWRKHFESSKVRVAFAGSECWLVYYLNPSLAIETEAGLTDPNIARMDWKIRGRIGHGKSVPLEYLKSRNVQLLLYSHNLPAKKEYDEFSTGTFSPPWRLLSYSPETMKELGKIGEFSFVKFEFFLDAYKNDFKKLEPDLRKKRYSEFEEYYFRYAEDKNRQEWYRRNL